MQLRSWMAAAEACTGLAAAPLAVVTGADAYDAEQASNGSHREFDIHNRLSTMRLADGVWRRLTEEYQ